MFCFATSQGFQKNICHVDFYSVELRVGKSVQIFESCGYLERKKIVGIISR